MTDLPGLIERYVAIWNEVDAELRAQLIPRVWSPEASLYNRRHEYHGLDGIVEATQRSCDLFGVRGYRFRPVRAAAAHHDAVRFDWEMLDPDGARDTLGTQFMTLQPGGLVRLDYQFIDR